MSLLPRVCPLSESQTQNSIAAYAKMFPTFTQQPRCVNCHGGVDPFADPTPHAGGTRPRSEEGSGGCNECHDNLPPRLDGKPAIWTLPQLLPDDSFVNRDARSLCRSMKFIVGTGENFVNHITNDEGKTDFNSVSFAGTRGLNEEGQALAFRQPYAPEPMLGISHDELIAQAKAWVDAMGGKFQGDKRCGCEPVHTAIKVYSEVSINTGVLQLVSAMGPVTIRLNFKDDGTFEGEGTLPFSAAGTDRACVAESQGSMIGKVSGKAIEDNPPNHIHIELTNIAPTSGATAVTCPRYSGISPLKGGDKLTFTFDMTGFIGEAQVKPVPLPAPGLESKLCVKLVDPDVQPPANDSPCVSNPDDWSKRIP